MGKMIQTADYNGKDRRNGNGMNRFLIVVISGLFILVASFASAIYYGVKERQDRHETRIIRVEDKTGQIGEIFQCIQDIKEDIREIKKDIRDR